MSTPSQPLSEAVILGLERRVKTLTKFCISLLVLLLCLAVTFAVLGWQKVNAISRTEDDIQFSQFVDSFNSGVDFVTPSVNVIQFLHHGYSITFDSVQYSQNGLTLIGRLGNPTNLWISSLAINMSASPFPSDIKDKWLKAGKGNWWALAWDFGNAQTTVGNLNPGSTAEFQITIPNVKQTPDGLRINVSFSGERYQYLGK